MSRWLAGLGAVAAVVALGGDRPALVVNVDAEVYPVVSESIEIRPGVSTSDNPRLDALARLTLGSTPAGAEVLLDGTPRGHTPLVLEDLALGAHDLLLRHPDRAAFHRRLRLNPPR